jgi:hypothetical protein
MNSGEDYDRWDDYTFLTYLAECNFRFSQNEDCSNFTMLRGWSRGGFADDDNWYYSLLFTTDNNLKINCTIEYNDKHKNNKYSYEYVNKIILPSINEFIDEFKIFNKYKINAFVINLINNINV